MTDDTRYERHSDIQIPEILAPETPPLMPPRVARRPRIRVNIALFLATILTTILAGAMLEDVNPLRQPELIYKGLPFSIALMTILLSHEIGHYLMSRKHKVDATLPYFIPAPTLIGTFGAIIKIRSTVPDRRALLDIGATGPIVGFLVSVPALIIGLKLSHPVPGSEGGVTFGSSIMLDLMSRFMFPQVPEGQVIYLHPVGLAGWLGLLVTMMNLLPMGMMDGGHITYALFGRWHRHISRAMVAILLLMGYFSWVGWAVWGVLNLFFGLKHPPPTHPDIPLDGKRKLVAAVSAIILILTFVPIPISMP